MLIHALNEYYDILSHSGKLVDDAYSAVPIHYLICLSEEGEIIDIIDHRKTDNSAKKPKLVPREELLPRRVETTGIATNYIEHRPTYIFGLNYDKSTDSFTATDKTQKAEKSHNDFVAKNLEFIGEINSPVVGAYRKFIKNFAPEAECENEYISTIKKDFSTARLAFCLNDSSILLHNDPELNAHWKELFKEKNSPTTTHNTVCAISGEQGEIARVHDKIKGFNAMGSVLIGVKEDAMSSYGKEQGYNAGISTQVMSRYTKALNYLMAEKTHKTMLDDITILHFAMSGNEVYDNVFKCSFDYEFSEGMDADDTTSLITDIMQEVKVAAVTGDRLDIKDKIDTDVDYYIIGLKPNSSRIAMKFIYKRKFGEIIQNIALHQHDMALSDNSKPISLWQMQRELKSPVSKAANIDPALSSKLMQSVLYGQNYPSFLLSTVVRRIKTDSDNDKNSYIKINPRRIAILKACINRPLRLKNREEFVTMALNTENTNEAYLCGRLFAVLEKLQQDASGGGLNKTIKDAYFSSACAKPATIFPKLLKLSNYHTAKAEYGRNRSYEIGEIISGLNDEFPTILTLEEQGKFIIGYYQQMYHRNNKPTETKEEK